MAGKGRPAGFRMDDSHRTKIANSQILNRLIGHVEGNVEMNSTQVTAGIALLKKVMPDLTHNQHEGADGGPLQIIIQRFADDQPSK
jgi:hypothetical protein